MIIRRAPLESKLFQRYHQAPQMIQVAVMLLPWRQQEMMFHSDPLKSIFTSQWPYLTPLKMMCAHPS